jgi:acyl CoA:acetate/3-ketoacid CoA transferase beta subunit
MEITIDEYMVVCISRQIENGEILAQGLATPLVAAGYLLARKTHAPDIYFMSAIGQTICRTPAPLSLTKIENLWLDRSLKNGGFVRAAAEILPRFKPKEFFRPAQVDKHGNFNNIALGKDYHHPRLRLPGTGGIADLSTFIDRVYLYVPRHSRITFVSQLDFLSGLGHNQERKHGDGPQYLVSDLGQFDFKGHDESGSPVLRLITYHPGVNIERIKAKTGFEFSIADDLKQTIPPSLNELEILRNQIDPLNIRKLELMNGSHRKQLLREILQAENES